MSDTEDGGRWVEPLRRIEADVPVPYRIEKIAPPQVRVELTVGQVVLINPADGVVSNGSGTPLFRLAKAEL